MYGVHIASSGHWMGDDCNLSDSSPVELFCVLKEHLLLALNKWVVGSEFKPTCTIWSAAMY